MAVLTVVAGAARTADNRVLLAAEAPSLVLNLHFTSSDALSPDSLRALMAEAESIWKQGYVRLNWLRESTEAEDGATLRVLVMARPVSQTT